MLCFAVDSVNVLTLAFPDVEPGLSTLLAGKRFRVDVHMQRFPVSEIPEDEEGSSEWCMSAYSRMDKVLDHHNKNGVFPGKRMDRPKRYAKR